MKKYTCLIFAKHPNCPRPYLFCCEPIKNIQKGTRLLVDTMYGEHEAQAISNSFMVDDRALKAIANGTGAYLPLKIVIGSIEKETITRDVVKRYEELTF